VTASVQVEIVVAVHDPARPIERAVGSVLAQEAAGVIVVVHNTPAGPVRARLGAHLGDPRLRILELQDGVRSPSGPFNAGLDAARARFVGVMGSDDELEPGAVAGWLTLQRRTGAAAVIARLAHAEVSRGVPTPPVRWPRRRLVDPVKDRLAYRSAPLGMWEASRFPDLRFLPGVATGEDVPFTTALWFSGAPVAFDARGGAYLVHADAASRVSLSARTVLDDLAFVDAVGETMARLELPPRTRDAIVRKLLRVNVMGALVNRRDAEWPLGERASLARITAAVTALGERPLRSLSRAEARLVDAMSGDADVARLYELQAAARRPTPAALLPRNPLLVLARDAPLRFALASMIAGRLRAAGDGGSRRPPEGASDV